MNKVLWGICLVVLGLCAAPFAKAQTSAEARMVAKATPYFGQLREAVETIWPDAPLPSAFAAQVEKESLWNPRAELCVPKPSCSRERGIGFGQFTITPRMNVFEEVKRQHPLLRDWKWEDRYDSRLQLIAIVVKDKAHHAQCKPLMLPGLDVMACVMSSYNGGFGGFTADRRLCGNTEGCSPQIWFGNVEKTSLKAKAALAGYGESFYQINRGYVKQVLQDRRYKYVSALPDRVIVKTEPVGIPEPNRVVFRDAVGPATKTRENVVLPPAPREPGGGCALLKLIGYVPDICKG